MAGTMAPSGLGGQISLGDFIAALEHTASYHTGKGQSIRRSGPAIDRILNKVVVGGSREPNRAALAAPNSVRLTEGGARQLYGSESLTKEPAVATDVKNESFQANRNGSPHLNPSTPQGGPSGELGPVREARIVHPRPQMDVRAADVPAEGARPVLSESLYPAADQPRAERSLPLYLIDQVGRQISRSMMKGEKHLRIQLRPPELGSLRIEMGIQGNGLKLGMIAESGPVRDLLLSSLPQLRESLSEQGIRLDRLDVQVNDSYDRSPGDLRDGSSGSLSKRQHGPGSEGQHGNADGRDQNAVAQGADDGPDAGMGDHLLDLMA